MAKSVERREDMSPTGKLRLIHQSDGDVIVVVVPDKDARSWERDSVEFCIPGFGGGHSPHTHKALIELMRAMERDNEERGDR